MSKNHFDFTSRISSRAVTAGILTTLSSMILLMTLVAGLGVWNFQLSEIQNHGGAFWTLSLLAWIVSVGVGAYVAALSGRSGDSLDGRLHGVTSWAGASVIGVLFLGMTTGKFFNFANKPAGAGLFWLAFIGNAIALIAALRAGASGAREEELRQAEIPAPTQKQAA